MESWDVQPTDEPRPLLFSASKAGAGGNDASMSEFHYLTYDHSLGSWSGELGSTAVLGNDSFFYPSDAFKMYWPEGKTFSFYAVGFNESVAVPASSVEFGSAMMLYSSGASGLLRLLNPGHDVDWLAAKTLHQEKTSGVTLVFRHVMAHICRLRFDLSEYKTWVLENELDIEALEFLDCSLSDVEEQSFIFSSDDNALFRKEGWDYRTSPYRVLDGNRSLDIFQENACVDLSYYAFPGKHRLRIRLRLLDAGGNQVIDDRILSGELELTMGSDNELRIKIEPNDRPLDIQAVAILAGWDSQAEGTVSE